MPHVIAIFGKTCVGKSAVAKALARSLNWPIRHCGETIKARARELNILANELPASEHKAIDGETRLLVETMTRDIIIEGNFLDAVLKGVPRVLFVRLTCEDSVRKRRFLDRSENRASDSDFALRDSSDATHRETLYAAPGELEHVLTIDTTGIHVDDVVAEIAKRLGLS